MSTCRLIGLTLAAAVLAAGTARAATITETYNFGLAFDHSEFGEPAPEQAMSGSFTVTWDPAAGPILHDTINIQQNSLVGADYDPPLAFQFGADGAGGFFLAIGGDDSGPFYLTRQAEDFSVVLHFADDHHFNAPTFLPCDPAVCGAGRLFSGYSHEAYDGVFYAGSASVRAEGPAGGSPGPAVGSPTPEPGVWGLMVLGFGGLGAVLRRRRRLTLAAA
jgi:hypothetical protein